MHKIVMHSNETSVRKTMDGYDVDVYLALREDSDLSFKIKRVEGYAGAAEKLALIRVGVPRDMFRTEEHMMVIAEIAALMSFVSVDGENCFSAEKLPSLSDVEVVSERSLVIDLLSKDSSVRTVLLDSKDAYLVKQVDVLSAFCYGIVSRHVDLGDRVSALISDDLNCSHVNIGELIHDCEVVTPLGSVRLTRRAVEEYLALPLNRELISRDTGEFSRPFLTVKGIVEGASDVQSSGNKHLKKLRSKFGSGAQSIMNRAGVATIVDLVPLHGVGKNRFIVIGFRQLYSKALQDKLSSKGFMSRYEDKN